MMKKVILLSVLAVSLSGCILDPYYDDDYPRHSDRNGQYDRHHGDRDWKGQHRYGDHDRYDRDRRDNR
ncbi:hypothetical protein [Acinetobacter bouvetii]|uniref:Lipoprotein n=1 Tax=Acinetobacter bouvetii TaxID=202951 RepID=A0A811G9H9_9GAMM|nr:hypothetical protein [Acinetobacter bouvetii]CAB1214393.1 hypothetical protein SFB21_1546 [Acinetobacter bouvetii]